MGLATMPGNYLNRAFLRDVRAHFLGAGKDQWVEFTDVFAFRHGDFHGSYNELFDQFSADAKVHFGATYFGEKTPAHTTFVRELEARFPAYAKVILLRDPRDIVCSYFNAWFDKADESLYIVLKILKCYLLNITHALREYDYYRLKYESLTAAPAEEMERICEHLSIPFSLQMLELTPTTSSKGVHSNLAKRVFANSKKYREILPSHYIAAIEAVLGEEMRMIGYVPEMDVDEHRDFVAGYLPIINEAHQQVSRAVQQKDSHNWHPSIKTKLRALAKQALRYQGEK